MVCVYFIALILAAIPAFVFALYQFISEERTRRKMDRWKNSPKDLVVLHGYLQGITLPSCSPYPLKVEVYLRLAKLKYMVDKDDMYDDRGKTPWISVNGKHVGDAEFILDHLNKIFEKDLNEGCSEYDISQARILRVMLEEFFIWGIGLERMVYGDFSCFQRVVGGARNVPYVFLWWYRMLTRKRACAQGIGQHSQQEVYQLMTKILRSVSVALGDRKYFGGDKFCQEDCGIFAVLAQCVWGAPDTPYEKLMDGECRNLKKYCYRMKEKAYPDWDRLIIQD